MLRALQINHNSWLETKYNRMMQIKIKAGKKHASWIMAVLATAFIWAGCGKSTSGQAKSFQPKSFQPATPETKSLWKQAQEAGQVNDYPTAVAGYKQLLQQQNQMSAAQFRALQQAALQFYVSLREAASNGDPAAQQALASWKGDMSGLPLPP
jgi:hypothetical protein